MSTVQLKQCLCLAGLALLAAGMAACGGSEPTPAARPPAPPPAPPPFQPQPVDVALGASGEKVTLMTKEGGGFTLNGEDFEGGDLAAENGATYTLRLADGNWSAAFKPSEVVIALGSSGESLTLLTKEGGGFTRDGVDFAGGEVMAGGMTYTVTLGQDGAPMAVFKPRPVTVPLGASGDAVMLVTKEGGGYTLDGEDFAGGTLSASNGSAYMVSLGEDGMWTARYQASTVTISLGASGGTLTVTKAEDGSYWLGDSALMPGDTVTGGNGGSYTLTRDAQGMWSATFNPMSATVALGTSGSVTLMTAEDGSWTLNGSRFLTGSSYTAANGNVFVLSLEGGEWTAMYQPATMPIAGTPLVAVSLEDGTGYQVGSARLPTSGVGDITVDGAMYHVWMDGGMLAGARFDAAIDVDTDRKTPGIAAMPTLSGNDAATVGNELRTKLKVGGAEFSIGELLGSGMSMARGKSFADAARAGLQELLLDARALISALGDTNPATLDTELKKLWGTHSAPNAKNAQQYVNTLFGSGNVNLSAAQGDKEDIDRALTALIEALSSADSFARATLDGGGGVFASAKLSDAAATAAFGAADTESTATLGMTGPTRYGTVFKGQRPNATGGVAYTRSGTVDRWVAVTAASGNDWIGFRSGITGVRPNLTYTVTLPTSGTDLSATNVIPKGNWESTSGAPIILTEAPTIASVTAALQALVPVGHAITIAPVTGSASAGFAVSIQGSSGTAAATDTLFFKKQTIANPVQPGEVGAFAYSTGPETDRMSYVRAEGTAYYQGGTRAVTGAGKAYSGDMELSFDFGTKRVDGQITNLRDADGKAWRYFYGDVDSIDLPTAAAVDSNGGVFWKATSAANPNPRATVSYGLQAGNPLPTSMPATFAGGLLGGNDAGAGSAATGVWTLGGGPEERSRYLAGGYGVERVADRPGRGTDSADGVTSLAVVSVAEDFDGNPAATAIENGMLRITAKNYGWTTSVPAGVPNGVSWDYGALTGPDAKRTYSVDLATVFENAGSVVTINGDRHADRLRARLQKVRDDLEALIGRNILVAEQGEKWRAAQFLIGTQLFAVWTSDTLTGATTNDKRTTDRFFPDRLAGVYDKDEAVGLLDKVLDAVSSSASLQAALAANSGGIFTTLDNKSEVTDQAHGQLWDRWESQVKVFLGTTSFTRFGVWRIPNGPAMTDVNDFYAAREIGRFAYSRLPPTVVADTRQPGYAPGGSATFRGRTVLQQRRDYYNGDAELGANWTANSTTNKPTGTAYASFSNIRHFESSAPLTATYYHDPVGPEPLGEYVYVVDALVFGNIAIDSNSSDQLRFGATGASSVTILLRVTEPGVADVTDIDIGSRDTSRTISGLFVGQNARGPVGAIGHWSLGFNSFDRFGSTKVAGNEQVGNGAAIDASFGVELPNP